MLNCKQVNEQAGEYRFGEQSLGKRVSICFHLLMCGHCRRYIKQLGAALDSVKILAEDSPCADEEVEKTLSNILAKKKKQ